MENDFYDNEFENYLKEQADDYRMYPSDQVWRGIQQEIHGYRKWPALGVIAIFIISALLVGTVLVKPHSQIVTVSAVTNDLKAKDEAIALNLNTKKGKKYLSHINGNNIANQIIEPALEKINRKDFLIIPANSNNNKKDGLNNQILESEEFSKNKTEDFLLANAASSEKIQKNETANNIITGEASTITNLKQTANTTQANIQIQDISDFKNIPFLNLNFINDFEASSVNGPSYHQKTNFENTYFEYKYFSSNMNEFAETKNQQTQLNLGSTYSNKTSSPLSRISGKSSKFDFQIFVTPSISYRTLVDDYNGKLSRSYISALPFAANYVVDINNVVQHKPAAGFEFGFLLGYNLNNKFAIRSGLQFNMRQYNINAFVHNFEPALPSLLTGIAIEQSAITGFRNITETEPIVLKNRYYQISIPVGIDWRPVNKKLAWGISASVQPTYTFDKEPFIVTTNYKNYQDGSQLMRNWNVNASIETYIGFNTGKYRWQLGPQIRTQLLPSLSTSYPIREYPVDYGIKLSLIKALK